MGIAISYLLGGEYGARLFNLSLFALAVALVCRMIRPWLSTASALLVVGLLASTPLAQHLSGSLFVENTWSVLLVGALVAGCRRDILSATLLCGTAVATKFGAVAFVLAMAPLFALSIVCMAKSESQSREGWLCWRPCFSRSPPRRLTSSVFRDRQPGFSVLNSVFRSPFFDPRRRSPTGVFSPTQLENVFYVDVQSHRSGGDGRTIGFHYFLFPAASS